MLELAGATEAGFILSAGFGGSHASRGNGDPGWWGVGQSSLEAELVRVADDGVGVHGESIEHHGGIDEVLLDALKAGVQLLEPHHLRSACDRRQDC